MQKNVAGTWIVYAYQDEGGANPGDPVTGDAAQITANVRIDGGAANAVDDTNPTELEDGYYIFNITAAEANGENIVICPASSTANTAVIGMPAALYPTPANFPDLSIAATTGRVDVASIEGSDATDQINAAADTAISDYFGTTGDSLTTIPWNAAWDTEVQSEVNDALVAIHLDHLLAVDYDPASKPGVATALLNELIESDAGVSRYTANALELAPTAGLDLTSITTPDGPVPEFGIIDGGTAQGATATTLTVRAAQTDDTIEPGMVVWAFGATQGYWQTVIVDSVSGDILTVNAWPNATPSGTITYRISGIPQGSPNLLPDVNVAQVLGTALAESTSGRIAGNMNTFWDNADAATAQTVDDVGGGTIPTAAQITDAVWDELQSGHVTAGSFGEIAIEIASILADTGTDGVALAADSVNASVLAADAVAEINVTVDTAISDYFGTAGASLTAIPWNSAWDVEVESEVNDALVAIHLDHLLAVNYDPASKPGVATALLNELIEDDAGVSRYTANALEQGPVGGGTVDANITQVLGTSVAETSAGRIAGNFNTFYDNADAATAQTLDDVGGGTIPTAAQVADAVWDELQSGHVTAGSFGEIATEIAATKVIADLLPDGGALSSISTSAQVSAVMTTQMTESYAANGVAPTPAQALFAVQQFLTDFAIAGTIYTTYGLDGVTPVMTHLLDDTYNPTSIGRTT